MNTLDRILLVILLFLTTLHPVEDRVLEWIILFVIIGAAFASPYRIPAGGEK